MTEPTLYRSLLEEVDSRQNQALEELTRLEEAIEKTIAEWTKPERRTDLSPSVTEPAQPAQAVGTE